MPSNKKFNVDPQDLAKAQAEVVNPKRRPEMLGAGVDPDSPYWRSPFVRALFRGFRKGVKLDQDPSVAIKDPIKEPKPTRGRPRRKPRAIATSRGGKRNQ